MKTVLSLMIVIAVACGAAQLASADEPIDIGSRLELFVDEHLIDRVGGDAELYLHKPEPQEVVLVTDAPWEGNTSAYFAVFQDGDLYRMYYRGSHYDTEATEHRRREVVCYAESTDGIHWTKPDLGLFEFEGSRRNNIVWDGIGTHNFTPFKDSNPAATADAKYKAIGRQRPGDARGLYAFRSPDGIHWSLMADGPVITEGAFDSQNLAFWDAFRGRYVEFHRGFRTDDGQRVRDIMICTSDDFLNWTQPQWLSYPDAPREHLYTNAILAYERAPHIFIGFPTRYLPQTQQVEPTFMASRDGHTFRRWTEALIPVTAPEDRDGNRSNYMAWGLAQLPHNEREYSVYASEGYYTGPDSRLRRFAYRVDGFVSVRAADKGGELVTKPLTFSGSKLVINFTTGQQGGVRVEIQDSEGKPLEGFTLADCTPLRGDSLRQAVVWQGDAKLAGIANKPVRLRFQLEDADLFSFQFDE